MGNSVVERELARSTERDACEVMTWSRRAVKRPIAPRSAMLRKAIPAMISQMRRDNYLHRPLPQKRQHR